MTCLIDGRLSFDPVEDADPLGKGRQAAADEFDGPEEAWRDILGLGGTDDRPCKYGDQREPAK